MRRAVFEWLWVAGIISGLVSGPLAAQTLEPYALHAQATYIWQGKPGFRAAYSGPNSLSARWEKSYSFTATLFAGVQAWPGGEFYVNLEVAQGVPLSRLTGLGGFTNGEISRTAGPQLRGYVARAFVRQQWSVGSEASITEADANQLAGSWSARRLVLTAGWVSVLDLFDRNPYASDPRTQFLNWTFMTHGAYDYAADARGYTFGFAAELLWDNWELRFGRFAQPLQPNQLQLDYRLWKRFGDQVEASHHYTWQGRSGTLRLLAYHNHARMARYREALALAGTSGIPPSLDAARRREHDKLGLGINVAQEVTPDLGVFGRAMWSDGRTETYAFTEIDRSVALGLSASGERWGRPLDRAGLATAMHFLSSSHRRYLREGGFGFFLGDGRLRYRPERVVEVFYSVGFRDWLFLTADWQLLANPGYNADRGPAHVFSLRLHASG